MAFWVLDLVMGEGLRVTDWIGQDRRWIGYDNGYGFVLHDEDEYDVVK